MTTLKVRGHALTREVYVDGRLMSPSRSQRYHNHSPDGFAWGYGGSGPAQLALALCLRIFNHKSKPTPFYGLPFDYQALKWDIIARIPFEGDFTIELELEELRQQYKRIPDGR